MGGTWEVIESIPCVLLDNFGVLVSCGVIRASILIYRICVITLHIMSLGSWVNVMGIRDIVSISIWRLIACTTKPIHILNARAE